MTLGISKTHSKTIRSASRHRCGFSITELLVVIGIIVLLAGVLLVALGRATDTARELGSQSVMESFARACDAFQQDHGYYPGVVPDRTLDSDASANSGIAQITATESALFHLMGGFVREDDVPPGTTYADYLPADGWQEISFSDPSGNSFNVKFNRSRMGEGPVINGKAYQPYFTPDAGDVRAIDGQEGQVLDLPDLVDAWGQPILYFRRNSNYGVLVGDAADNPQYIFTGSAQYLDSMALGDLRTNQVDNSILRTATDIFATFAQIIRNPGFGDYGTVDDALAGTPRGAYVLISAGPDGIYFNREAGPGTPTDPVDDIVTGDFANPQVLDEYDDVRVFGGG